MAVTFGNGLNGLYRHIMQNAHLELCEVTKPSPSLGRLCFVELDRENMQAILPVIRDRDDRGREKIRFMLDVALLNLLRQGKEPDDAGTRIVDLNFSTLSRTAFRTRYLVVLAEMAKKQDNDIVLNIVGLPDTIRTPVLGDLLRYLMPVTQNISVQLTRNQIMELDLARIPARHVVLTTQELTTISRSARRADILARLSRLPGLKKEIIVRDETRVRVKREADAFYL